MAFDLNTNKQLVYDVLIHAIKTDSGIGFCNNDQGHPAYMVDVNASELQDMGDSPDENDLYQTLRWLTDELGQNAHTPIRSWRDFCHLASEGHQKARDRTDR